MKKLAFSLLLVFAAAWLAWQDVDAGQTKARPWMSPVVTREELAAMDWVRANTAPRTLFATDIFGGEFLMGNTLREATVGGDWAIIPNVVERMRAFQYDFYGAASAEQAHATAVKYGAAYAWVPNRQIFAGYSWVEANRSLFVEPYFTQVYGSGVAIYKVNP